MSFPLFIKFKKLLSGPLAGIIRFLTPTPGAIGGLEISDSHIRFLDVRKGRVLASGLRLPPGIVQSGRVIDSPKLIQALLYIRSQLKFEAREKINVIIGASSEIAYLQTFNLPYLNEESLASAAELNLQMISPIPFGDAYADWEEIGEITSGDNRLELMGAFAEKANVDGLIRACRGAGFVVVAVEPSIISLVRAIRETGGIEMNAPHILLRASDTGMDFTSIRNNKVYFNYFLSWHSVYGEAKEVSQEVFEGTVVQYIRKVLTYSLSHGEEIKNLVLASASFNENFKLIIGKNFGLEVVPAAFGIFEQYGSEWGVAIGAYRRGLLPRSEDSYVTLTSYDTEEEFRQAMILGFIKVWRNAAIVYGLFLLVAFAAVSLFTARIKSNVQSQPRQSLSSADLSELSSLSVKAKEFNELVALAARTRVGQRAVSPYFEKLARLARENSVTLKRIHFQSFSASVALSGEAGNDQAVVAFKNVLGGQPEFGSVQLPLTSIMPASGGNVSFSMTLVFNAPKTE